MPRISIPIREAAPVLEGASAPVVVGELAVGAVRLPLVVAVWNPEEAVPSGYAAVCIPELSEAVMEAAVEDESADPVEEDLDADFVELESEEEDVEVAVNTLGGVRRAVF